MCGECGCKPFMGCHVTSYGRRFLTKEEKIEQLENYAEELKKEIVAIDEQIKDLRSED
jgi:glycyl-tRNA synthetase beta subunit